MGTTKDSAEDIENTFNEIDLKIVYDNNKNPFATLHGDFPEKHCTIINFPRGPPVSHRRMKHSGSLVQDLLKQYKSRYIGDKGYTLNIKTGLHNKSLVIYWVDYQGELKYVKSI